MKRVNLVCLLALLVCMGCKREKPEAETVEEPVEVPQVVGGTDAVSRIKALYEGLFTHYNKGDFDYDVQSVFSSRLRGIWSQLPENELVYSSNVWTDLQDFDSLVLEMVTLENQIEDTAMVAVRFRAFEDDIRSVRVRAVRESLRGNLDWYVDDIIHPHQDGPQSIAGIARGYAADSIVHYLWAYDEFNLHQEDNVIELRFKDSVVVDGFFWGTSDEFYDAREGFYPGFSVWQMQDISMAGDTIGFMLDSRGVDYFSGPLALDVHTAMEAKREGCHLWRQFSFEYFQDTVRYQGRLMQDTLLLFKEKSKFPYYEEHRFVRKTEEEIMQSGYGQCDYEEDNRQSLLNLY